MQKLIVAVSFVLVCVTLSTRETSAYYIRDGYYDLNKSWDDFLKREWVNQPYRVNPENNYDLHNLIQHLDKIGRRRK